MSLGIIFGEAEIWKILILSSFYFYEFSNFIKYIYFFPCRKYSNVYLLKSQQGKEHKNIIA